MHMKHVAAGFLLGVLVVGCGSSASTMDRSSGGGWSSGGTSASSSSSGGTTGASSGVVPAPPNVGPHRPDGGSTVAPDAGAETPDAGVPADMCDGIPHDDVTLYQSADDSNSMASPVIARSLIERGLRVPAAILRTYEFLNYYNIGYAPAPTGKVAVVPQMMEEADGTLRVQVGLSAEATDAWPRRAVNLTLVLDTSGSMGFGTGTVQPIELERAAVRALARSLQAGDVVSMVTWNVGSSTRLSGHVVQGPDDATLLAEVDRLNADGGTDLEGGLRTGYALALQNYSKTKLNRVVLISDGQANVGITSADLIALHSHAADGEGIYLAGIGVGDGVNDTLMDIVTDRGRGAYVYLNTVEEADRMLHGKFLETMEVAARGVRLELTLPWYLRMTEFHGEQSSTVASEVDPQHLAPGQSMVFAQAFMPCSSSVSMPTDVIRVRATWDDRTTRAPQETVVETTVGDLLNGPSAELKKGNAIVAYADALRDSEGLTPAAGAQVLREALLKVRAANASGADPELLEIDRLLVRYIALY